LRVINNSGFKGLFLKASSAKQRRLFT